jgi:hypothetical protein
LRKQAISNLIATILDCKIEIKLFKIMIATILDLKMEIKFLFSKIVATIFYYTNDSTVAKFYKYIAWGLVKYKTTHRELKLPNQIDLLHSFSFEPF